MRTKKSEVLEKVYHLKELFDAGKIKQEHQHEVNPGLPKNDRLNYLYFTLPVSINYQRSSPAMWASALKTYNDSETNYLFYPEQVVLKSFKEIQASMVKHKLALQRNRHVDIWIRISQTLADHYDSDPTEVLREGEMDVSIILEILTKKHKKRFPYLSGAKMSNYWLYILHHYTDAQMTNLNQISIIPDTHVQQCSVVLGLTEENVKPDEVAQAWFDLLAGTDISPIDMHPVLWNWSRSGFFPVPQGP